MKNKLLWILPLLFINTSCKPNKNFVTFIGADIYYNQTIDSIDLVCKSLEKDCNKSLAQKSRDYHQDLKVLETNPTIFYNSQKYSVKKLLDKTSVLIFAFDYKSVMSSYNESSYYTDVEKDLSLWDYYVQHINEELIDLYSAKSIMLSLYNPTQNEEISKSMKEFNNVLKEHCENYGNIYLDTTYLNDYIEGGVIKDEGIKRVKDDILKVLG